MNMPHDALKEYIDNSELRVIIDGVFNMRMSTEITKNFDAGLYNIDIDDFSKCVKELVSLNIKYPANAKPIFYMYVVPDTNFIELLQYPYKDCKRGGRAVMSYDIDGFGSAYGISQNLLGYTTASATRHVNRVHEFVHLIQNQFCLTDNWFSEGFAELIPWYVLEYEKYIPEHFAAMKSIGKIYTVNELLQMTGFSDVVSGKTCSYQPSYISSYLALRAIVEHVETKYNLNRVCAVQKILELIYCIKFSKQWFVIELAKMLDMDIAKLLDSNEYQIEILKQMEKKVKK